MAKKQRRTASRGGNVLVNRLQPEETPEAAAAEMMVEGLRGQARRLQALQNTVHHRLGLAY
mgnify:CR=1 FL=1